MKHFIIILFLFISCIKDESRDADNLYESKNFIGAIELYNEIINLKPNDIKSIYRRGRSYEELKQFELAFKDYQKVLETLKPIINDVLIIDIQDERVVNKDNLIQTCKKLDLVVNDFKEIKKELNYLVFGSFSVVEEFLKVKSER